MKVIEWFFVENVGVVQRQTFLLYFQEIMATSRQRKGFTAYVYEDDYVAMQKLVQQYPNIHTGGDLFGLWQDENNLVIQLFNGPGKECRRTPTSFHQDVEYLGRIGTVITKEEGLCTVGEWHSHHQIGMPEPSKQDNQTVLSNMPQLGLDRFVLFIANIKTPSVGKSSHDVLLKNIEINCFIYREGVPRGQQLIKGKIVRLGGTNPHQQQNKAKNKIEEGAEPGPMRQEKERAQKKPQSCGVLVIPDNYEFNPRDENTNKLERLLQCSICREMLKDPRTLPCFHSYCKDCLGKYVENHHEKNPVLALGCPVCGTEFTLGSERVPGMQQNHFICYMLDVLTVQRQGVLCSHCKEPSVARCVTCEQFLCKNCSQSHNDYPGFRNHSVLSMGDLSKPENIAKIKGRSHCKKHDKKKLKFYCNNCNEVICRYCMDFDHLRPDHACVPLESISKNKLDALKRNCSTLEHKLNEGNQALQALTNDALSLKHNMEKAKIEINQKEHEILAKVTLALKKKAESLVKGTEEKFKNKHSIVIKEIEKVQAYVNKVKASVDLSSMIIANGNDEEIVSTQKLVQENVEKIQSVCRKDTSPNDTKILHYHGQQLDTLFVEDIVKTLQGTNVSSDKAKK